MREIGWGQALSNKTEEKSTQQCIYSTQGNENQRIAGKTGTKKAKIKSPWKHKLKQ